MAKDDKEIKIFSLNRIKFAELYEDAMRYLKASYKAVNQVFTTASPFGLLLQVVLHLGRMIFYYIEDSITGLNMRTAYRPDQVRGLATLVGHEPGRTISSRGACRIYFVDKGDSQLYGNACYIPNKTLIISKLNGLTYTILMGADYGKITMQSGNYINANLIQGIIKMQRATGTGAPLLSYNFGERNYAEIDQYFINVYVNNEPWPIVKSLIDLGYNLKGCVVRTGINSGIDLFFGNGDMGLIPDQGSEILVEYILSDGETSNISKDTANSTNYWEFVGNGKMNDGTSVNLKNNFKLVLTSDLIFGNEPENIGLTLLIAPHTSKSFVLANESNYEYFFRKMNMFSLVGIIRGSYTLNGTNVLEMAKTKAYENYLDAELVYKNTVDQYGINSENAKQALKNALHYMSIYTYAALKLNDNSFQDNTIYIFLVPDITKRIASGQNYFECDESAFYLSEDEQANIINLLNESGQRIITIENRIIQPKLPRFAINVEAKIWDTYEIEDVYAAALEKLSEYFLNFTRKDIIPLSDVIAIFENNVQGIDSVRVSFAADVNNQDIYGKEGYYGIDDFGDIVLTRTIVDANGQYIDVRDIIPLIRGGFIDSNGVDYSSILSMENMSAFNLTIVGKTSSSTLNLKKYNSLT